MTKEEYKILLEKSNELSDEIYQLLITDQMDSERYQELKLLEGEIEDKLYEYEKSELDRVLNEYLESDIQTCMKMLSSMEDYTIGSHICGMNNRIMCSPSELADSILQKGLLSARREGGGIAEDVHILGNQDVEGLLYNMLIKFYESAMFRNTGGVVVAIPTTMLNEDGERVSIGTFPNDLGFIAKDDPRIISLPINSFVRSTGCLPKEFILGVVSQDENGNACFHKNDHFIAELSPQDQIEVYKRFVSDGLRVDSFQNVH